ncbi:MAG: hypothetical protein HY746_03180 [Elusimicrobia bacterium]|nr:hypothetical protein [Elusimicrobiota bacterium]
MHVLNIYFIPFALILILSAIYFSEPDPRITYVSFAILFVFFLINRWLSKNAYKFIKWTSRIRILTVWLNLAAAAALFYLLGSYWAPTWLLFLIPPALAAMFMKKAQVFLISLTSLILMLGTYYVKSRLIDLPLSSVQWAMACIHALFVIFFALFVQAMSEMAVKMRDTLK